MNALTDVRTIVVQALEAGFGDEVTVYDWPPGTMRPPAVIVTPGRPWLDPTGQVTLQIECVTNAAAGISPALDRMEQLVHDVREALLAADLDPGNVDPPRSNDTGSTLSCSMDVIADRTHCR